MQVRENWPCLGLWAIAGPVVLEGVQTPEPPGLRVVDRAGKWEGAPLVTAEAGIVPLLPDEDLQGNPHDACSARICPVKIHPPVCAGTVHRTAGRGRALPVLPGPWASSGSS